MEEQEVVVTPKTKINKLSIIIAVVLTAVTSVFASFFFLKDYYMVEPTTYTKLTEIQELIDKYYYLFNEDNINIMFKEIETIEKLTYKNKPKQLFRHIKKTLRKSVFFTIYYRHGTV